MSKERELLKKCAAQLNSTLNGTTSMRLAEEIEELLAKPEQEPEPEPEPVVWMFCEPTTGLVYFENSGKMEHGWIPLYMAPPAPEPLSDEEIYALDDEVHGVDGFAVHKEVLVLIRAVEKAHGIGVK